MLVVVFLTLADRIKSVSVYVALETDVVNKPQTSTL